MVIKFGGKIWTPAKTQGVKDTEEENNDVDIKHTIKYGTKWEAARAIFAEYCDNSTICGFKYIGEYKRAFLERLFWLLIFLLSIYACIILIVSSLNKWNNDPVILSFDEKLTSVWEIPFPTVTVCLDIDIRRDVLSFGDLLKTANEAKNLTQEEKHLLLTAGQICSSYFVDYLPKNETEVEGSHLINLLSYMLPFFNDTFLQCKWRNTNTECNELFQKYVTDDGVCFSFNSLSPIDIYRQEGLLPELLLQSENRTALNWDLENGYKYSSNLKSYPKRVLAAGAKAGLQMILNTYIKDFEQYCHGGKQGFKILLNAPGEVPDAKTQYTSIQLGQDVLIAIRPKIITTSDYLKDYEPYRRQCYFQNEYNLRYFTYYTQSNCERECLANFTLAKCGCVKYSMSRNIDVPVCGVAKIKCLRDAQNELLIRSDKSNGTISDDSNTNNKCNCLPACNSIAYDAEVSQADFDHKSIGKGYNFDKEKSKVSRFKIFFKEPQFLTYRRSELYGTIDFLANCGGILGLFLGVSTFSIIELIYFCTVRLIMHLRMRFKNHQDTNSQKNASKTNGSNNGTSENIPK